MEFKKGDKVNIVDGSYSFGYDGKEKRFERFGCGGNTGKTFTVESTDHRAMRDIHEDRGGQYTAVCDTLVSCDDGSFYYTQQRFLRPAKRVIVIDERRIEISQESFDSLKRQLAE